MSYKTKSALSMDKSPPAFLITSQFYLKHYNQERSQLPDFESKVHQTLASYET